MSLITRTGKGSKLTIEEMDGNINTLASASLVDGVYSKITPGGGLSDLPTLSESETYPFTNAEAGEYVVNNITTNGNGSGLVLNIVIQERRPNEFTFLYDGSTYVESMGMGYQTDDELYIPYSSIGGTGTDTFTMVVDSVTQEIENSITVTNNALTIKTTNGDGGFIDLTALESTPWYSTGSSGTYTVTPTTDGEGSGVELELVVINTDITYSIDLDSSSIINPGSGYAVGDTLIIAGTDLGGTPNNDPIEMYIEDGSIASIVSSNITTFFDEENTETAASISADSILLSAANELSLVGKNINLTGILSTAGLELPTDDPEKVGEIWVDTENGFVLKISQG